MTNKKLSYDGLEVGSKEYKRVSARRYYQKHKEHEKSRSKVKECRRAPYRREYFYGISQEQFHELVSRQDGKCAICKNIVVRFDVDHDHSCCSGKGKTCGKCNRGLLCRNCNTFIGLAKDSIEILSSAISYLENYTGATLKAHF